MSGVAAIDGHNDYDTDNGVAGWVNVVTPVVAVVLLSVLAFLCGSRRALKACHCDQSAPAGLLPYVVFTLHIIKIAKHLY